MGCPLASASRRSLARERDVGRGSHLGSAGRLRPTLGRHAPRLGVKAGAEGGQRATGTVVTNEPRCVGGGGASRGDGRGRLKKRVRATVRALRGSARMEAGSRWGGTVGL